MNWVWHRLRRVAVWSAAFVGLIKRPASISSEIELEDIRRRLRREIDEFNRLLTATVNMRDVVGQQVRALELEESRAQTRLRRATETGNDRAGAEAACRLRSISGELAQLREQLREAGEQVDGIARLRDQAIAKARAELRES